MRTKYIGADVIWELWVEIHQVCQPEAAKIIIVLLFARTMGPHCRPAMPCLHRNLSNNAIYFHYDDVIMGAKASQITSLTTVYSAVYSGADQSKHQSCASLVFMWAIHRGPVNSPHKWPVTRKMFQFDCRSSSLLRSGVDLSQIYNIKVHNNANHSE